MFYVKTQLNPNTTLTTELNNMNVFTRCPDCGEEMVVDLNDVIDDENLFDLFEVGICCTECSRKRWNAANNGLTKRAGGM